MAGGGRVPGPVLLDVAFLAVYWDDVSSPKAEVGGQGWCQPPPMGTRWEQE